MSSLTDADRLSLDRLAALAGVTPRTVRFYIAEGLVDRPEGEKRGAYYVQRHLDQLLRIRGWTDRGISLERVRALMSGAPDDPMPRPAAAGSVEVWSRITVADGVEVQVEPGRAHLGPAAMRQFVRGITALYREIRSTAGPATPAAPASMADQPSGSSDE